MPNDAKIGLAVGVGLVIAVGVLFFRKDAGAVPPATDPAPAGIVRPLAPTSAPPGKPRPDDLRTTAWTSPTATGAP